MRFQELVILLPCHSIEDFPVYTEGDEANGLLAAWTSLWHPAFIHSAQSMPTWSRMDDPPNELEGRLLVIPPVSHTELPTGFVQRAKESGGCPIRRKDSRDEIVTIALEALDDGPAFDAAYVKDFFALGYAYLQVQILTRQMRYSSNLDEVHFANQVVAAANALADANLELAEEKLTACFDLLSEERDLFYSVDSYIIDLVMLGPGTLGAGLESELDSGSPVSFLLSAGVLEALAGTPVAERLTAQWRDGAVGLIACDARELPLPLLPMEAVATQLQQGRDAVAERLGQRPRVFGRRRYGLSPTLPQLLQKLQMPFALHATFEDGRFPEGAQVKTLWEGSDRTTVEAIAKAPLNAALPETFLGLALKTGETMDMDHVATMVIAHWPGQASPYLEDLRRAARRTSALGKLITIDAYFSDTDRPSQSERLAAARFRSPYLRQAIVRQQEAPLSRWVDYHRERAELVAAANLGFLASSIDRRPRDLPNEAIAELDAACETRALVDNADASVAAATHRAAAGHANEALKLAAGDGVMLWNPYPSVRRVLVPLPGFNSPPERVAPVYAIDHAGEPAAVVDLPPMGYVHLRPGPQYSPKRSDPVLVEGLMLRNEFLEITVNPQSGGIGAVRSYETRGNRMSQQLAMRVSGSSGERAKYSTMVADNIETLVATRLEGAIRATGRLLDEKGETAATFQQTLRVVRGSRILGVEIELDPLAELRADPWNSYFASRVAWRDESAELACDVNQARHSMEDRKRIDASHYIEMRTGAHATTIFPRGLPYHRRVGLSSLDTLLIVRNEPARAFQLGIGVDVAYPLAEALALAAPPRSSDGLAAPGTATSAWLFHLQAKNVTATRWQPLVADGRVIGFEARLLETAGRAAQVRLQSLRPIARARVVNLDGEMISEARVEQGAAHLELSGREWLIVRAEWAE
ncbi:MAG: hypothetical protein KDB14_17085 [Planctomycetales bacterium]|nr:hypothetical protein [Planctomycetales bacterium]